MKASEVRERNRVEVTGVGEPTFVLGHGFGCDQRMWSHLVPHLDAANRIVTFDYVGSGRSDLSAFSPRRYKDLHGYAQDLIEVCDSLELVDVVFVGHSVSSMIGLIASLQRPELFSRLVMVCPNPSFLNDPPDYMGGFDRASLEELIALMAKNDLRWVDALAPMVINPDGSASEELVNELSESFASTDPVAARCFAEAPFFADVRDLLPKGRHPTLVLQSARDALASVSVGRFTCEHLPFGELAEIEASGHCLHMTHPEETARQILSFVENT